METNMLELVKLTPSKTNVKIVSEQLTEPIINGEIDAVEFSVRCEFAIQTLKNAQSIAKKEALKKDFNKTCLGAKVEIAEAGVIYDFSSNEKWLSIENKTNDLLIERKKIEEQIKISTKLGKSIIDENTGDIIASPVKKESTTTLKITLEK